jgi:post-segregation antitoxin (ccd killing protein)
MSETIVTSIRIKAEVWKEAKQRALDLDMHIGDFVESAIIHEIQKKNR